LLDTSESELLDHGLVLAGTPTFGVVGVLAVLRLVALLLFVHIHVRRVRRGWLPAITIADV
jgi:hypothetical protein